MPPWQGEDNSVLSLLSSIFQQINDPDSIYAVIQAKDLTSLLPILEHEGKWAEALDLYASQPDSNARLQSYVMALNHLNCRSLVMDMLPSSHGMAKDGEVQLPSSNSNFSDWMHKIQNYTGGTLSIIVFDCNARFIFQFSIVFNNADHHISNADVAIWN